MKSIAFITGTHRKKDPLRDSVYQAARKVPAELSSVGTLPLSEPLATSLLRMLRSADVVIADATEATPNLIYEIGVAHGLGKPVVVLAPVGSRGLPSNLAGVQVLEYSPSEGGLEIIQYRLSELLREHFISERVIPSLAQKNQPTDPPDLHSATSFREVAALETRARSQAFESWFSHLARGIPQWEIVESESRHRDNFDCVIWNRDDEADLASLGNPIPVELKAVRQLKKSSVSAACQQAQLQRLKGLILATTATATPAVHKHIAQTFAVQNFPVILLDFTALQDVESPAGLVRAVRSRLREITYGG